jgi:hypothetical protein
MMQAKDNFLRKSAKKKTLKTLVNYTRGNYGIGSLHSTPIASKHNLRRMVSEEDLVEEYLEELDNWVD